MRGWEGAVDVGATQEGKGKARLDRLMATAAFPVLFPFAELGSIEKFPGPSMRSATLRANRAPFRIPFQRRDFACGAIGDSHELRRGRASGVGPGVGSPGRDEVQVEPAGAPVWRSE